MADSQVCEPMRGSHFRVLAEIGVTQSTCKWCRLEGLSLRVPCRSDGGHGDMQNARAGVLLALCPHPHLRGRLRLLRAICTDTSFHLEQPSCRGDESPHVPHGEEPMTESQSCMGHPPMAPALSWVSALAGKVGHLSLSARSLGAPHTAASVLV